MCHSPTFGICGLRRGKALLKEQTPSFQPIPDIKNWVEATDENDLAKQLTQAALSGSRMVLQSPRGLLIGGTGSVVFAHDENLPASEENVLEVALPPEPIPLAGGGTSRAHA